MLDNREWAIIRELMPLDDPSHTFIGDDCAVWRDQKLLVTTDHMAEGVHFDLSFMPPDAVGWRLMAANASDIIAMGSRPTHFTLNLALPADRQEAARGIIAGIVRFAKAHGIVCIGGDTTGGEAFFIGATMFGPLPERPLLRSGARPGDRIFLAGEPGLSKAGLLRLQRGMNDDNAATRRFLYPDPLGQIPLLGAPSAAIDLSDSLVSELTLLANASGVSMELATERIPVHPLVAQTARELNLPLTDLLLTSGEEFFLIVTAPGAMPGWHEIGLVTERRTDALTIRDNGVPLNPARLPVWDHFGR
ncbi:MAG TPA: thiamine-phosphate kinase [bacterium]|nr:thiamine-phosphate kinase [bacterium]